MTKPEHETSTAERTIGGKYRVLRLLGEGGMGAVYEAENTWTRRRVALKVMSGGTHEDAEFARRFMQEAQTAARLRHPNIVDVLDMGQDEASGEIFIVQELLVGRDLGRHLSDVGMLTPGEAIGLLTPVMEALVATHAIGVVHRDLKPDNIFLAETPRGVVPTLIDFGIAKVVSDDGSMHRTRTGMLMGTPYYMSPEQARGDSTLDARSDVWSIGVVLYELLSGTRPFQAANANSVIAKIIYEPPQPVAVAAPHLPRELTEVVMRAVHPDVEQRYPTMQAFLDALRALPAEALVALPLAGTLLRPVTAAVRPGAARRAGPTAVESTLEPHSAPTTIRRRRWPVAVGVSVVLGALALATWQMTSRDTPPTSSVRTPVTAAPTSTPPTSPVAAAAAAPVAAPTAAPTVAPGGAAVADAAVAPVAAAGDPVAAVHEDGATPRARGVAGRHRTRHPRRGAQSTIPLD